MQAAALRLLRFFGVSLGLAAAMGWAAWSTGVAAQSGPLRIEVSVPASAGSQPLDGRVLLMLSTDPSGEPRFQISDGVKTQQVFGVDVDGLPPGQAAVFDAAVLGYPVGQPRRRSRRAPTPCRRCCTATRRSAARTATR